MPVGTRPLSWLRPSTLWQSRNDVIARRLGDPTESFRAEWIARCAARAQTDGRDPDFGFALSEGDDASLLVLGDTGEGDSTQYAMVPALLSQSDGVCAAVICSDVIYPTGDIGDYADKFYRPYRDLPMPILAVPGNHDWYDGLHGFMHHLCELDAPVQGPGGHGVGGLVKRLLWRDSPGASPASLAQMDASRRRPGQRLVPPQPAPYFHLDAGPLRFVAIDTGISGSIDAEQGCWLARVSRADPRPKVLLTGKPLYVDGERRPCEIVDGGRKVGLVDDVVRDPECNYVAAIGGDIHNYQRYPVTLPDGRTIQFVVSGGGGAFMHATHQIPKVDLPGVDEADFRCYPLRGDSLARYSMLYDQRLAGGHGALRLSPEEASTYLRELLNLPITRGHEPVRLSRRARAAAHFIQPLPAARGFHRYVSEVFDFNDPPFFKTFLRLDARGRQLRIRCFGVTGCAGSEDSPSLEDDLTITL